MRVGEEPTTVLKAAEREMRRQAASGLVVFPDALSVLDRLTIPAAVASNSDRWRLEVVLNAAGIRDRFEVSVAGDEVPSPKPAPDIYLRAAALLNVDVGDCLVIEDSPTGLTAARAAGMKVVAVRRGYLMTMSWLWPTRSRFGYQFEPAQPSRVPRLMISSV